MGGGSLTWSTALADLCPYIALPSTWNDYLGLIGKNARKNLARRWRRLQEQGPVTIDRVESAADLERSWRMLRHLHQMRREAVDDRSAFLTERSVAFHERFLPMALTRGWLRFYLLLVKGRCIAVEYGLHFGSRIALLQSGFDVNWAQYGIGKVLIAHAIRTALEEGATEVVFLRGGEVYKQQQWAAVTREDRSVVVWRRHPRIKFMMTIRGQSRAIKERVKRRLAPAAELRSLSRRIQTECAGSVRRRLGRVQDGNVTCAGVGMVWSVDRVRVCEDTRPFSRCPCYG